MSQTQGQKAKSPPNPSAIKRKMGRGAATDFFTFRLWSGYVGDACLYFVFFL